MNNVAPSPGKIATLARTCLLLLLTFSMNAYSSDYANKLTKKSAYALCKNVKKTMKRDQQEKLEANVNELKARGFEWVWCDRYINIVNLTIQGRAGVGDIGHHPVTDWMRNYGYRFPQERN